MKRKVPLGMALKKLAAEMGRIGGEARAKALTPERRREIAIKANRAAAKARANRAQARSSFS
jgi:hypothetical protein